MEIEISLAEQYEILNQAEENHREANPVPDDEKHLLENGE